jgi:hypothetical protein
VNTYHYNSRLSRPAIRTLVVIFGLLVYTALIVGPTSAIGRAALGRGAAASPPRLATSQVFTISGIVRDTHDAPVQNIQVFAFSGAIQANTLTNSAGRFMLQLDPGSYDVVFNPPVGSKLASRSVRGIRSTQDLTIILPPGHAISGTVYRDMQTRLPVPNTAIFAFNRTAFHGFGLPPSDAAGAYHIALEAGDWDLTFTPPPFLGLGPVQTTVLGLAADKTKDIFLVPGFTLFGKVVTTRNGAPSGIPNVEIFARDPAQASGIGFSPTNASGVYTGTLPVGTFDVLFHAPPFSEFGSSVLTAVNGPPDRQRNVTLPPGYTLSGSIRCGSGVANAFVLARPDSPLSAGSFDGWGRFAGTDGTYGLALQPGTYTIVVSTPAAHQLPGRVIPSVDIRSDRILDIGLCNTFLPLTRR